jgi:hypothetical protein
MSSISAFRGAIRSGVQRQHKWEVQINFPAYAGSNDTVRQASLLARTTALPESTLGVMDVNWGGRTLPLPGDRTYGEFSINFIGVNDNNVYFAFQRWSEAINGSDSNSGLTALDDFMRDVQLQLKDMGDATTMTYILRDAWPTVVSGVELDSGALDSYTDFTVTFRYVNYSNDVSR